MIKSKRCICVYSCSRWCFNGESVCSSFGSLSVAFQLLHGVASTRLGTYLIPHPQMNNSSFSFRLLFSLSLFWDKVSIVGKWTTTTQKKNVSRQNKENSRYKIKPTNEQTHKKRVLNSHKMMFSTSFCPVSWGMIQSIKNVTFSISITKE